MSKFYSNYFLLIVLMSVGSIVIASLLFLTLIICDIPPLFLTRLGTGISVLLIFSIVYLHYLWLYSFFWSLFCVMLIQPVQFLYISIFMVYLFQSFYFYTILILYIWNMVPCRQHKVGSSFLYNLTFSSLVLQYLHEVQCGSRLFQIEQNKVYS